MVAGCVRDDLGILSIWEYSDYQKIVNNCLSYFFSCTDDENVTVEIPTPPTGQEDEQSTHLYVAIGMYFVLEHEKRNLLYTDLPIMTLM